MYKVISTFSGIGGSSQGYKQAGFEVVAAVEFLDYQARNYVLNHKAKMYNHDIRQLDPLKILSEVGLKPYELDVLDGSPPCSSFSTAGTTNDGWGKKKKYGNKEQRTDDLFYEFIRFLDAMKPKVFVAENVSGLVKGVSKGHFNEFIRSFRQCGYDVKAKVLNAANYGVPQSRERLIFIGVRNDIAIAAVFPKPSEKKITLKEAFKNINNSAKDLSEINFNHTVNYHKLCELQAGEKAKSPFMLYKSNPNDVARTLSATDAQVGYNACNYHWENRKFTVKECKAIASVPQSYKLIGKDYREKVEGLGRCVPPKMMQAIAETIKTEILDKI